VVVSVVVSAFWNGIPITHVAIASLTSVFGSLDLVEGTYTTVTAPFRCMLGMISRVLWKCCCLVPPCGKCKNNRMHEKLYKDAIMLGDGRRYDTTQTTTSNQQALHGQDTKHEKKKRKTNKPPQTDSADGARMSVISS
jgi:hypothetical protein